MLTLVRAHPHYARGVSRQGGLGIGGGTAAGRHRALSVRGAPRRTVTAVSCASCGQTVTTTFVVHAAKIFCSWDCAGTTDFVIPGQFLG